MDRRLALVALWAVFAAAAVGVGFGAAGLVGDPFVDGFSDVSAASDVRPRSSATADGTPDETRTPDETQTPGETQPPGETQTPDGTSSPSHGRSPAGTTGSRSSTTRSTAPTAAAREITRTISTTGGLVSATCQDAALGVGASPAVGWEIEDIDDGSHAARVRFERVGDGDGRVEVEVTCASGRPRFALEDDSSDSSGGDDSDGDDSGGDDGGGDDGGGDDGARDDGARDDGGGDDGDGDSDED